MKKNILRKIDRIKLVEEKKKSGKKGGQEHIEFTNLNQVNDDEEFRDT